MERSMNAQSALRWILIVWGGALLVAAGLLIYRQLEGSRGAPTVDASMISARGAYGLAEEAADAWQADAQLVSAAGRAAASVLQRGDDVEWSFQFFSAAEQRLIVFAVSGSEVAQVRETRSPYAMSVLDTERWRVDSHEAYKAWLEAGGDYFVTRRPSAELAMRLHALEDSAQPVWTVAGVTFGQENVFAVTVDARSGTVLDEG